MALEVKVYKEISAYDPKVMWGMSWRQIGCTAVMIPIAAMTYYGIWYLGFLELAQWATVFVVMPFVLVGWVRPKGLRFEKYAKYVISGYRRQQKLRYEIEPFWSVEREVALNVEPKRSESRAKRTRISEVGQ
ncbi:MAG: PrgI family protein [Actinomycetaceae bacterium]|nr:PrgI family protein [Actinomycetaceae bacterium]